jgi:hypothetical protein
MPIPRWALYMGAFLGVWEIGWWARRRAARTTMFNAARLRAVTLGRPLVVVGDPDGGVTAGYPCGDVTIDLRATSACPHYVSADITKAIPLASDSSVVFVACVLEYVSDVDAALCELLRVAGSPDNLFVVRVEPWTLTAFLYPGAQRTITPGQLPASCPAKVAVSVGSSVALPQEIPDVPSHWR